MIALKTILLPTDFSDRAASAARHAKQLALRFNARLVVMHAIPPFPVPDLLDPEMVLEGCRERGRARLGGMYADNGFRPNRILVEGDPATAIVNYARENEVDLIMMPTAGRNGFRRYLIGSVTAKTLHDAECPVWTTTHVEAAVVRPHGVPKEIACAVDLQPGSDSVLSWAAGLAEAFGARLTVIHAVAAGERHPEVYYLEADLRRYLMEQAKEKIASMLRNTACPAANVHVDAGSITSVVRSAAEDRGAQLLVIGRSSRPGAGGNFSTNSYALIRESPCPVVSI